MPGRAYFSKRRFHFFMGRAYFSKRRPHFEKRRLVHDFLQWCTIGGKRIRCSILYVIPKVSTFAHSL